MMVMMSKVSDVDGVDHVHRLPGIDDHVDAKHHQDEVHHLAPRIVDFLSSM